MPTTLEYRELQSSRSWTDDLPVCKLSGIGYCTNQIYREDGQRIEQHSFEDTSFHCKYDDDTYLYVIFDGNDGRDIATFALQRIAAEILLGQLVNKTDEEEIQDIIRQAFLAVEDSYLESIDDKIAERTQVQLEIPEHLTPFEAYQQYPHLVNKLTQLSSDLSCGASALLALIHMNKLYIANVGDCRALLCKTDSNNVLRVVQLTVDHNLDNEDEILRLSQLGVKMKKDKCSKIGNVDITRCLGNYLVKGGYKDFEEMADAIAEPIISEPEICGGIPLNKSCRFLMLMSKGLYKSLEEATGTEQVNKDLAQMAVEQFRIQSTLTSVAQAVIDKVSRKHHDAAMGHGDITSREDITLIIRNFNFPLPNSIAAAGTSVRFNLNKTAFVENTDETDIELTLSESLKTDDGASTSTTGSEQEYNSEQDGLIKPYVDFSEYYRNIEQAKKNGTLPKDLAFD